jgi:capsular exopolysaccharide synthesis family protein
VTAADGEIHLLDRLAVLHKYRYAASAVFLAVVAWLMVDSYTTIPQYRAVARIVIEDENSGLPAEFAPPSMGWTDPEPYLQTQYRILKGRELARRVAARLDLEKVPEFNGQGPEPTRLGVFIARVKSGVKWPLRALAGTAAPAPAPAESAAAAESARERGYVDAIIGRVQAEPVRGSRLVDVSFEGSHPAFVARAVNTHVDEYVSQNLESKLTTLEKSLSWLDAEVERQRVLVQTSERALADYREQKNALSLDSSQNVVVTRLNQLNDAVTRARTDRIQKEGIWKQVQAAGRDRATLGPLVQNATLQNLRGRLSELQRDRALLLERYFEKHPEVMKVQASIAEVEGQIDAELTKAVQTIRNEYEAAVAQERSLSQAFSEQSSAAAALSRKSADYSVLERNAESNQKIYNELLQRQNGLRVIANSRANNIRVVDRAEVPSAPFTPNHRRDWLFALALGLGLGVAVAFAIDYMDDTVKTPEDVAKRLSLRPIGLIPAVRGERHPLISGPVPHDFNEAFRSLRTAVVSQFEQSGPKVIAMTSAQPLEGKTTVAVNVAMALAVGGARVLLIDADMRRPNVHKTLRLNNDRGLSQLLAGQARMREVVQRTHDPNLLTITAGRTPSNPSELLASERMRALVEGLYTGPFDWVLIDTPPVLAVTDAVIVAPLVEGMVFVVGSEMTRWPLATRAVETLKGGNPRAIVAVLNKVDYLRNRYYYSRYYGSQYKSYYQEAPAA